MKTILLLNGSKKFGSSEGRLSATLQEVAKETLSSLGHCVDIPNARLVDGRALDSQRIHR